jgi:hypothetical protein
MQCQNRFIVVQKMSRKVAFQNRKVAQVACVDKFFAQQKLNMLSRNSAFVSAE